MKKIRKNKAAAMPCPRVLQRESGDGISRHHPARYPKMQSGIELQVQGLLKTRCS